jgi:hypothetical protein
LCRARRRPLRAARTGGATHSAAGDHVRRQRWRLGAAADRQSAPAAGGRRLRRPVRCTRRRRHPWCLGARTGEDQPVHHGILTTAGVLYAALAFVTWSLASRGLGRPGPQRHGLMAVTSTLQAAAAARVGTGPRFAIYLVTFTGSQPPAPCSADSPTGSACDRPSSPRLDGRRRRGRPVPAGARDRRPRPAAGRLLTDDGCSTPSPTPDLSWSPSTSPSQRRAGGLPTAMVQLSRSRRRTGATRWELYRDAEHPDHFVEIFRVRPEGTPAPTRGRSPPPTSDRGGRAGLSDPGERRPPAPP